MSYIPLPGLSVLGTVLGNSGASETRNGGRIQCRMIKSGKNKRSTAPAMSAKKDKEMHNTCSEVLNI